MNPVVIYSKLVNNTVDGIMNCDYWRRWIGEKIFSYHFLITKFSESCMWHYDQNIMIACDIQNDTAPNCGYLIKRPAVPNINRCLLLCNRSISGQLAPGVSIRLPIMSFKEFQIDFLRATILFGHCNCFDLSMVCLLYDFRNQECTPNTKLAYLCCIRMHHDGTYLCTCV